MVFRTALVLLMAMASLIGLPAWACAWLLHEHAQIGRRGAALLAPLDRDALQAAWAATRAGGRTAVLLPRFDDGPALGETSVGGARAVGFAPLPALAGDHACDVDGLDRALGRQWIADVLATGDRLRIRYRAGVSPEDRVSLWNQHHLEMRNVDARYRSRAEGTGAHFLIERYEGEGMRAYVVRSLNAPVNAMALYVNYHIAALARAQELADRCGQLDSACLRQHSDLAWQMFLAEAFALHFLEDAFSAGHMMGAHGRRTERLGTHNHYCRHGLEARLWNDRTYVAHGDAHLTQTDLVHASMGVAASLTQLAAALRGAFLAPGVSRVPAHQALLDFDACPSAASPLGLDGVVRSGTLDPVVRTLPRAANAGAPPPRFLAQNEIYVPMGFALEGAWNFDWPDPSQEAVPGGDGRVAARMHLRTGLGITVDAVSSRSHDRFIVFTVDVAGEWRLDDTRAFGIGGFFHIPWAYAPVFDLVGLLLAAFDVHTTWGLRALEGGLGGWQRVRPVNDRVDWQILLLRRFGFNWYPNYFGDRDRWHFDFPVVGLIFGEDHAQRLGRRMTLDLGIEVNHVNGTETTVGVFARYDLNIAVLGP